MKNSDFHNETNDFLRKVLKEKAKFYEQKYAATKNFYGRKIIKRCNFNASAGKYLLMCTIKETICILSYFVMIFSEINCF